MADLIRDAPIGQIIRYITRNRVLLYPEERPDFQCPEYYGGPQGADAPQRSTITSPALTSGATSQVEPVELEKEDVDDQKTSSRSDLPGPIDDREALERPETARSKAERDLHRQQTATSQLSHTGTKTILQRSRTQADLEAAFEASLETKVTHPIEPQVTSDGIVLVDWYTTDDPENPQNWSYAKKILASMQIYLYTLAVYMGSSIYTSSEPAVMEQFGVGPTVAALGLSLYVLAYGTGPLIFSPLSEIPAVGRNPPYMATMIIFVILCVPAALVENVAGLMVIRFLQGFFGSPALATGGASISDMYSFRLLPYMLALWALAATGGPALGPVISGFSVPAESWHWSLWEMLWLSGPVLISMMLFLPETFTPNILYRRAQRLRKLTGNNRLKAQSEIDQANTSAKTVAFEALVRPMQLMIMDPAIGYTAAYVALCYGIYYSFFEVFPLVYADRYGFNLGQMGLVFLSIIAGSVSAVVGYYVFLYYYVDPRLRTHGLGAPEQRLIPAMFCSFLLPTGLFIFGWTGNGQIYFMVSVVGIYLFTIGVFVLMQCIFIYLPLVYPQYAASLFAGNDFARSLLAFAAVMFSRPMYTGIGVGDGVSLLGALTAAAIVGIFILYFYGERLRARSRFSAK